MCQIPTRAWMKHSIFGSLACIPIEPIALFWLALATEEQIPVARVRGDSTCGPVDLAAGAKIYLLKESGRVTAVLSATDRPRSGMRWIQMDDNWSLQNLLVDFFGRRRDARG